MEGFIGNSVSIKLKRELGVFQGVIVSLDCGHITINKCFHNGMRFKRQEAEIKISKDEITDINILQLPSSNTPSPPNPVTNVVSSSTKQFPSSPKPKTENNKQKQNKNKKNKANNFNDDPLSDEEFDFEKNLALFDKQAVFREIEASNPPEPDLVRHFTTEVQYRYDQNVLETIAIQERQILLEFSSKQEYNTDEGLIIPSIPQSLRNRIQNLADSHGFLMERQNDMLARGAVELALQLLGGARRFTPQNQHQLPGIVVICDEPYNERCSEIGISTARQLASHELKVTIFVKSTPKSDRQSKELELFTATGNNFTYAVKDLPKCDLIIMSVKSMNLNSQLVKYIQNNRAPVMAVDPPCMGISDLQIKCSIVPILPLDDLHACGKIYLCNTTIPLKFFTDAGIKYRSPFGNKLIMSLHLNT